MYLCYKPYFIGGGGREVTHNLVDWGCDLVIYYKLDHAERNNQKRAVRCCQRKETNIYTPLTALPLPGWLGPHHSATRVYPELEGPAHLSCYGEKTGGVAHTEGERQCGRLKAATIYETNNEKRHLYVNHKIHL